MPFHSGVTGLLSGIAASLLEINPLFLLAGFIIFLVIVFYVVKTVIKTTIVGVFSVFLLVLANFLGVDVPITLQTIIMTATLGIAIYIILGYVELGFKILKAATYPVRKALQRKPKEKESK